MLHEKTQRQQKGRLGCGRDVGIEKHENRFADIERREGCGWDAGAREVRPLERIKESCSRIKPRFV